MKNEVSGHWKKLVSDPKYLGAADLEGMPEIAGTIGLQFIATRTTDDDCLEVTAL